jgi:DNA-binding FadR family transcriptional regulator
MINYAGELAHAILRVLARHERPIGSGTLHLILRRQGVPASAPTIGRKVRELEFEGLLRKISVDGRVITDRGRAALERWEHKTKLEGKGQALLGIVLDGTGKKSILDFLAARRVIEREAASLAARHASPATIRTLEKIVSRQMTSVNHGELGIEEDVAFHEEIAKASRNEVLYSLVSFLRSNGNYSYLITRMRTIVGSRLIVDHTSIVDAIKKHDPEAAREAMDAHLAGLSDDIARYWKQFRLNAERGRRRALA